jgi:hypothetical protein
MNYIWLAMNYTKFMYKSNVCYDRIHVQIMPREGKTEEIPFALYFMYNSCKLLNHAK